MTEGFPCAKGNVSDLWVRVTYLDRDSGTKQSRNVTACGLDEGQDNVVARLSSAVIGTAP
jgi:hypothetical protein